MLNSYNAHAHTNTLAPVRTQHARTPPPHLFALSKSRIKFSRSLIPNLDLRLIYLVTQIPNVTVDATEETCLQCGKNLSNELC